MPIREYSTNQAHVLLCTIISAYLTSLSIHFLNSRCDGRDTDPPTSSPAPSTELGAIVEGEVCTICENTRLDPSVSIPFQTQQTTCGNVNQMVMTEQILVGSATCNSVRQMYKDACCFDECQLCKTPDGDLLDMRSDYVVKQGGYEASCQEVNNILNTVGKFDTMCTDAQAELADECCYAQCSLCGEDLKTDWYATVSFQSLSTTCLGLDFMLRTEQISAGNGRCSQIKQEYMQDCCYVDSAKAGSCQLCMADDIMYDVLPSKTVTVVQSYRRSTTTTCSALSTSMATMNKNDNACIEGKQAYFGQCCDLTNAIGSGKEDNTPGPGVGGPTAGTPPGAAPSPTPGSPTVGGGRPNASPGGTQPQPSPTGGMTGPSSSTGSAQSLGPTLSSAPSSEFQPVSIKPTLPNFWDNQPTGGNFSWDQNWQPPSAGCQHSLSSLILFLMSSSLFSLFVYMSL